MIFWVLHRGGTTTPPRSALCIVQKNEYIIDFIRIIPYIEHITDFGGVFGIGEEKAEKKIKYYVATRTN